MKLTLSKWGNSNGIRLPMKVQNILGVDTGDEIEVNFQGNKVILYKAEKEKDKELTIEEMFKDYKGKPFKSEIFEFEPVGNEKW